MAYSFVSLKDVNEIQVVNSHLIKRGDVQLIRETIRQCIEQYDEQLSCLKNAEFIVEYIEISKQMRTAAGTFHRDSGIPMTCGIKLAYNNYIEFGTESMLKTLRHEMAHLIEHQLYGSTGHSERFKKICVNLGGHMNSHIAGNKYKDNSTADYCKSKTKDYVYSCSCGVSFKRKKRLSVKELMSLRCRCGVAVKDMKMEVKN